MPLRACFLTRYDQHGPSSRVRSLQLISVLRSHGIEANWSPLLTKDYLAHRFNGHIYWPAVVRGCIRRLLERVRRQNYDVYIIEKELLPWIPFGLESLLWPDPSRTIVDYDDAIFHSYDMDGGIRKWLLGNKIARVMKAANAVTVGNEYLAEYARKAGAEPRIVRSSVDCDRFVPASCRTDGPFTIGWIGSPITAKFLDPIQEPLAWAICALGARVLLVGAGHTPLSKIGAEVIPWTIDTEVALVQSMDVGIMPLPDTPFERGKCGYKLIQYMACGKPVIASPVGINNEIVTAGANGFLPSNSSEWKDAFTQLHLQPAAGKLMGMTGRERVVSEYSIVVAGAALAEVIKSVASHHERMGG